jgi:hypothetical protein
MRPTPHARRTAEPQHARSSGCCVLREGQARLPVTGCGEGGKVQPSQGHAVDCQELVALPHPVPQRAVPRNVPDQVSELPRRPRNTVAPKPLPQYLLRARQPAFWIRQRRGILVGARIDLHKLQAQQPRSVRAV